MLVTLFLVIKGGQKSMKSNPHCYKNPRCHCTSFSVFITSNRRLLNDMRLKEIVTEASRVVVSFHAETLYILNFR